MPRRSTAGRPVDRSANGTRSSRASPRLPVGLYAYIWRVSGRAQIGLAVLSVVVFILDLIPLELQRRIVDDAIDKHRAALLAWLALAYGVVALCQGAAKLALNIGISRVGEATNRRLRLDTRRAALPHPETETEAGKEGVGISIILSEVESLGGFVGNSISAPVLHAGVLLSVFGYMVYLQPWLALVVLAVFGPQLVFVPLWQEAINRRTRLRIQILRKLSVEIVNETAERVPAAEEKVYATRVGEVYQLNMQIFRRKYAMNFSMNLLHHLGIVGILFVGGWLVLHGRTQLGTIVAFISGLNRVNDPWGDLVNYFRDMTNARVKYHLIAGVLNEAAPDPVEAAVQAGA